MRAIQQCSTDLYRTAVTSSYCVSYRRLAIKILYISLLIELSSTQVLAANCKNKIRVIKVEIVSSTASRPLPMDLHAHVSSRLISERSTITAADEMPLRRRRRQCVGGS